MAQTVPRAPVVLVTDDEPGVRGFLRLLLGRQGFDVRLAASGEEALTLFGANPADFDAVLLDVNMPGTSGPETLRRLRQQAPGLPALFMSGGSGRAEVDRLRREFDAGLIAKPFKSLDELATRLRGLTAD